MASVADHSCSVQDCNRPRYVRGYCRMHYKRWLRNKGDFFKPHRSAPIEEWFWYHVKKNGSHCWSWGGATDPKGYGIISHGYKNHLAHRVSFELHHGPIPDGWHVCHRCDNPRCTNPDHLYLGSHYENIHEAAFKVRLRHKLSPAAVRFIRKVYAGRSVSQTELAEAFDVHQSTISLIVNDKAWVHVEE